MPVHDPDADAFMRRILSDPADPVPRLVFADWLDETGTTSNAAWARYLRFAEDVATAPADDPRRPKLTSELDRAGSLIRARLAFRAEVLVAYPEEMLRLLPARCLAVNVSTVVVDRAIVELVPESVARESLILPLGILRDRTIVYAAARPAVRSLADRLGFIVGRPALLIGVAPSSNAAACLDRNYVGVNTESVDSVHYNWLPTDGLQNVPPEADDAALPFVNGLLLDTILYVAELLEFETDGPRLAVWHWFGRVRQQRDYLMGPEIVPRLVPLLRSHVRNAFVRPDGALIGEVSVSFWNEPRTLSVQITERPNGHHVFVTIPSPATSLPAALNPAA